MNKLNFIVTGTGRCGTVYLAKLLTSVGIPCGHESIFRCKGGVETFPERLKHQVFISTRSTEYENWLTTPFVKADSSYLSAPFLNDPLLKDTKIIHLVRNPIRVIFSFCESFNYFTIKRYPFFCEETFIHKTLLKEGVDLTLLDDPILRATMFYIKWNELIERQCHTKESIFHKIEDDIKYVLNFVNKPRAKNYFMDKRANTHRHNIFSKTIHDIPDSKEKDALIEKSLSYGYDLFNEPKPPRMMFM
ncbi:MAG: hypothetical protein DWQ19_09770 [Crenarchaeota archaeon]|nr:MAG: hypothetical protein DWQ19_09770 [Thermoproteota archaeon]